MKWKKLVNFIGNDFTAEEICGAAADLWNDCKCKMFYDAKAFFESDLCVEEFCAGDADLMQHIWQFRSLLNRKLFNIGIKSASSDLSYALLVYSLNNVDDVKWLIKRSSGVLPRISVEGCDLTDELLSLVDIKEIEYTYPVAIYQDSRRSYSKENLFFVEDSSNPFCIWNIDELRTALSHVIEYSCVVVEKESKRKLVTKNLKMYVSELSYTKALEESVYGDETTIKPPVIDCFLNGLSHDEVCRKYFESDWLLRFKFTYMFESGEYGNRVIAHNYSTYLNLLYMNVRDVLGVKYIIKNCGGVMPYIAGLTKDNIHILLEDLGLSEVKIDREVAVYNLSMNKFYLGTGKWGSSCDKYFKTADAVRKAVTEIYNRDEKAELIWR